MNICLIAQNNDVKSIEKLKSWIDNEVETLENQKISAQQTDNYNQLQNVTGKLEILKAVLEKIEEINNN